MAAEEILRKAPDRNGSLTHNSPLTEKKAALKLNGGVLQIEWSDGTIWQEGPAAFVFDGETAENY